MPSPHHAFVMQTHWRVFWLMMSELVKTAALPQRADVDDTAPWRTHLIDDTDCIDTHAFPHASLTRHAPTYWHMLWKIFIHIFHWPRVFECRSSMIFAFCLHVLGFIDSGAHVIRVGYLKCVYLLTWNNQPKDSNVFTVGEGFDYIWYTISAFWRKSSINQEY